MTTKSEQIAGMIAPVSDAGGYVVVYADLTASAEPADFGTLANRNLSPVIARFEGPTDAATVKATLLTALAEFHNL